MPLYFSVWLPAKLMLCTCRNESTPTDPGRLPKRAIFFGGKGMNDDDFRDYMDLAGQPCKQGGHFGQVWVNFSIVPVLVSDQQREVTPRAGE